MLMLCISRSKKFLTNQKCAFSTRKTRMYTSTRTCRRTRTQRTKNQILIETNKKWVDNLDQYTDNKFLKTVKQLTDMWNNNWNLILWLLWVIASQFRPRHVCYIAEERCKLTSSRTSAILAKVSSGTSRNSGTLQRHERQFNIHKRISSIKITALRGLINYTHKHI